MPILVKKMFQVSEFTKKNLISVMWKICNTIDGTEALGLDELLGHLKNSDVFQGEDRLTATKEKVFKHVENHASDDIEERGLKITQGCEIVITTGCLTDCLERWYTVFNQCNYMVHDEIDRMIDMRFELQAADSRKR
ncbi:hypothetical protein Bca4012_021023 [Brassica carinata]|uniref:Uncharacterized protein n=1 Tax=Brassica carinata TaxID=52824 RepID=A0A8X7WES6_BRACI|nr:hypothetical protein Bca52824_000594 [Brassica carinata]